MSSARASRAWFLASLLPAFWPRSARATVAWSATHESGNLSEWTLGPNPTKTLPDGSVRKNVEVVGEQVHSGRYACRITLHPDDTFGPYNQDRVDIQHASTLTAEGTDSYLSGYFYLPEDAKTRNEILFYETKVSFRNWMDLWVEPKTGGGTTVKFGIESQGANLGSVLLWTGDWSVGQWHQFAIHVHWSTNPQTGVVDVWFDGQPVISGHKHNTKFDNNAMFFNVGLHRVLPKDFVEMIYFDDFIEADTQSDIKIGAPMNGSDGGTGDAATSADASDSSAGGAAGAGAAGAAGASSSGTGGGSGGFGGGAGGVESGTAGNGGTGSAGVSGTTTGANAGAGGAATTGHAAPADAPGCTCVVSGTSSPPKQWDAAACFFTALALLHRRRRPRR